MPHKPKILESFPFAISFKEALSRHTTFQLGGPCLGLISCITPEDVTATVNFMIKHHLPFLVIGGGSNLVFSDSGVECYIIKYNSSKPLIDFKEDNTVLVSGGTSLDHLAKACAERGLEGLNYCTGIPGTVAGAVLGNAGAWGKQVGDVLISLEVLDDKGEKQTIASHDIEFSYRHSSLKNARRVILSSTFKLNDSDSEKLIQERQDILSLRASKHPDLDKNPCAGSFFRNIEPTSKAGRRQAAGWFLEEAGVKAFQCGGAKIFEKHANIIVKGTNCRAQDVYDLSKRMADAVKTKFNLDLCREVHFVGRFDTNGKVFRELIW